MSLENKIFDVVVSLPFCHLGVRFENGAIVESEYLKKSVSVFSASDPLVDKLTGSLQKYVQNPSSTFDFELAPDGTDFQRRVWQQLCQIPVGQVMTYGEIAKKLKSSPRAVGNACRQNRIPLIIPCHRVVSSAGIGGFAGHRNGYFIDIKRQLLRHEGLEF